MLVELMDQEWWGFVITLHVSNVVFLVEGFALFWCPVQGKDELLVFLCDGIMQSFFESSWLGWQLDESNELTPINIIIVVSCACKVSCTNQCRCVNAGIPCTVMWSGCTGSMYTNTEAPKGCSFSLTSAKLLPFIASAALWSTSKRNPH